MTDIVERLRQPPVFAEPAESDRLRLAAEEAADTITALRAENERLRAGLGDIHAAAGNNHLIANIARATLEEKPTAASPADPPRS